MSIETFLERWKTPNTYGPEFAPLPRSSGIYLFVRVNLPPRKVVRQILYVGMSTNIKSRLTNHEIKRLCDSRYDYVQVWFRPCAEDLLRQREQRLIQQFNPCYNLQHRRRGE